MTSQAFKSSILRLLVTVLVIVSLIAVVSTVPSPDSGFNPSIGARQLEPSDVLQALKLFQVNLKPVLAITREPLPTFAKYEAHDVNHFSSPIATF